MERAIQPAVAPDLLAILLTGGELTREHVDRLVDNREAESLIFEAKRGSADDLTPTLDFSTTSRRSKTSALLRKYAAGFANARGGILAIGLKEGEDLLKDRVVALEPMRNLDPDVLDRVKNSLLELHLQPPPVLEAVPVDGGHVLLIAIGRQSRPIYTTDKSGNRQLYYRMGNSTAPLPLHLASDVVFGRFDSPMLELILRFVDVEDDTISFVVGVQNNSPIWVDKLAVQPIAHDHSMPGFKSVVVNRDLAKHVRDLGTVVTCALHQGGHRMARDLVPYGAVEIPVTLHAPRICTPTQEDSWLGDGLRPYRFIWDLGFVVLTPRSVPVFSQVQLVWHLHNSHLELSCGHPWFSWDSTVSELLHAGTRLELSPAEDADDDWASVIRSAEAARPCAGHSSRVVIRRTPLAGVVEPWGNAADEPVST